MGQYFSLLQKGGGEKSYFMYLIKKHIRDLSAEEQCKNTSDWKTVQWRKLPPLHMRYSTGPGTEADKVRHVVGY